MKSILSLLIAMLALSGQSVLASVTATIDRNQITEFDVLTLTIRVSGDDADATPDFSPIERDFEILNTQTKQSSSFSFVNGRQTSTVFKDYVLALRAKRKGQLSIPPINVGVARTDRIRIQVVEQPVNRTSQMNRLVFFDTSVDTISTYVQGQIIYSVKLLYADSVSGDFPPPPDLENAVVETIEAEKRYETTVDNRRYYVLEKQYAIFPQRSGTLTIPRETFIGTRGRGGLFSSRQRVNALSKPISIEIKPAPSSFTGDNWLAAKSVALEEAWSITPVFRVGEPINRTITLTATGVAASQLPPLATDNPGTAKLYADPPELNEYVTGDGITSISKTTVGIVPVEEGPMTLPEVRVAWWNTVTDQAEVAIIPERTYQVMAAAANTQVNPPVPVAADGVPGTVETASPYWQWLSFVLFASLVLTVILWRRTASQLASITSVPTEAPIRESTGTSEPHLFRQLEQACKQNEAAAALQAFRQWAKLWASERNLPFSTMRQLAMEIQREDLAAEIATVEELLYRQAESSSWNGGALLTIARELRRMQTGQLENTTLAELNPL